MNKQEVVWELVNPEGVVRADRATAAPRPANLKGKTVGLYWNSKPGGREALDEIAHLLEREVEDIAFVRYWDAVPASKAPNVPHLNSSVIMEMAALKPDVVVCSQGD